MCVGKSKIFFEMGLPTVWTADFFFTRDCPSVHTAFSFTDNFDSGCLIWWGLEGGVEWNGGLGWMEENKKSASPKKNFAWRKKWRIVCVKGVMSLPVGGHSEWVCFKCKSLRVVLLSFFCFFYFSLQAIWRNFVIFKQSLLPRPKLAHWHAFCSLYK